MYLTTEQKELMIGRIDVLIEKLQKEKTKLLAIDKMFARGTWFIRNGENKYYQLDKIYMNHAILVRHNEMPITILLDSLEKNYKLASAADVERHKNYLKGNGHVFITTPQIQKELTAKVVENQWVIDTRNNKYYQFIFNKNNIISLARKYCEEIVSVDDFNTHYRLATPAEGKQHLEFLSSGVKKNTVSPFEVVSKFLSTKETKEFNPEKCEFYMITCKGEKGSKVRHYSYEEAEKEAIRIAKIENHETWIVGVVASVKPEVVITVNKR